MRWMRWSWNDYDSAPQSVLEKVVEMMLEDAKRRKAEADQAARRKHR